MLHQLAPDGDFVPAEDQPTPEIIIEILEQLEQSLSPT
jgi:hypothetical protein